jgi:hypothetical protein
MVTGENSASPWIPLKGKQCKSVQDNINSLLTYFNTGDNFDFKSKAESVSILMGMHFPMKGKQKMYRISTFFLTMTIFE